MKICLLKNRQNYENLRKEICGLIKRYGETIVCHLNENGNGMENRIRVYKKTNTYVKITQALQCYTICTKVLY